MGTLVAEVVALGLAVAFTSRARCDLIVLLTMPSGRRRALAFVGGWLFAIAVLGALTLFVLHGQDFGSRNSTPSRAASAFEVALGCALLVWAVVAYRRRQPSKGGQSTPKWLARIEQTTGPIGVAVGAIMLSYGLSLAAASEILKANVGRVDAGVALGVFALLDDHRPRSDRRRSRRAGTLRANPGRLEVVAPRQLAGGRARRLDGRRCSPDCTACRLGVSAEPPNRVHG